MGFFDNYGTTAEAVNENPFSVKRGTYDVTVSEAEVKTFKNPTEYFVITYDIVGGPEAGKNASQMFRVNPLTAADQSDYEVANARTLSNFKKALLDLGLTPEQINAFDPRIHGSRIIGIKGKAVIGPQKNNPEYNQLYGFTRANAGAGAVGASPVVAESVPVQASEESVDALLSGW
jgi:hypothetical protein